MKFFLILILFISQAHAWTLINSGISGFQSSSSVKVYITSNDCVNAGITQNEMESLIKDAFETFWNSVPTSALELEFKGTKTVDASAADLNSLLNDHVTDNQILVGCSSSATLFTSANTLAVGSMACLSYSDCRGAVLLNDTSGTLLSSSSKATILATFAHELGHALGLGHTSVKEALMYYSVGNKTQKKLNQDDIDGITYLYPNEKKLEGLMGACATIDTDNDSKGDFGKSMFVGFSVVSLIALLKRRKFFFS